MAAMHDADAGHPAAGSIRRRAGLAAMLACALAAALVAGLLAAAGPRAGAGSGNEPSVRTLDLAERSSTQGAPQTIALPDTVARDAHAAGPPERRYRLRIDFDTPPHAQALYWTGLLAHARVAVNGQVVFDTLASGPLPRGPDRIVLVPVPDPLWQAGPNRIDIEARGSARLLSLSPLQVGPVSDLAARQRERLLGAVIGPGIVAAIVATLGLCMLLLWWRLRDPLHGLFGAGTLAWALHTTWTIVPGMALPPPHNAVWWTTLYTLFVAMLVVFCLRFARWHWRFFELMLAVFTLACPAVMYLADAREWSDTVGTFWRLAILAWVGTAALAIGRAAWLRSNPANLLVAATGLVCLGFGVHDWLVDRLGADNNPVFWVPYAGLMFVAVVMFMLIQRLVQATQRTYATNAELELRVAQQHTALIDALEKMRHARDKAEAADMAKSRVLAAASHDLRQPAHAMSLHMAALDRRGLDIRQFDVIERVAESLGALNAMLDSLMNIVHIETGALVPQPQLFAVDGVLRRLANELAPQAEARGLRVSLRVPPRPARVWSDPLLVERIVRNLLGNAIKYTAGGGILLSCRARRAVPGGPPRWCVEVWDTGIGIADADRDKVFEEFFQIANPGRDRSLGLGLGLSIVRRLVDRLDLQLTLRSRPGRGSRFSLWLPVPDPRWLEARLAIASPTAAAAPPRPVIGLRVAVLEDDLQVRRSLCDLLLHWGCRVSAADDAAGLIAADPQAPWPDALIVDHRLRDGRTGPAEAETLFRHWRSPLPVLVVTGDCHPATLNDIRARGHACLEKPAPPAEIRAWLEGLEPRDGAAASSRTAPDGGPRRGAGGAASAPPSMRAAARPVPIPFHPQHHGEHQEDGHAGTDR